MRQPVPFGKYLLLDRISVGGMAEVFKAKSYGVEGFEKIIAIKRILPTMGEDRDFIKMFIDEAKIAGQLAHANICQIFELGRIDGSHFIAMEYIWGKDLLQIQNRLRKLKQAMPIAMACFCIAKVLEGLDYAHRKRDPLGRPLEIVHRDCSPQNVLVSYEGEVKVIDFGIAKATSRNSRTMAGVLKGKFGYMSPEQVRGLPLDRRSDLFALGTMLYECLTGDRLFQGETDFSTLEKVRNVDVRPPREINPNIPPAVEAVIMKALAKDVEERYQWCSEMLTDLQAFLMSQDVVFTAKSLSSWLKDVFSGEIDRERQQLEQYKRVGRDGLIAGVPAAEAKMDVVESLGEAPPVEGDPTMLGGPNFDDVEHAAAASAEVGPAPGSPATRAPSAGDGDDDEGADFGEEAPTEIFGEIDHGANPMAAAAQIAASRGAVAGGQPLTRPPKPPPAGRAPTSRDVPVPAIAANGSPGRTPAPELGYPPAGAGAPLGFGSAGPPVGTPAAMSAMPGMAAPMQGAPPSNGMPPNPGQGRTLIGATAPPGLPNYAQGYPGQAPQPGQPPMQPYGQPPQGQPMSPLGQPPGMGMGAMGPGPMGPGSMPMGPGMQGPPGSMGPGSMGPQGQAMQPMGRPGPSGHPPFGAPGPGGAMAPTMMGPGQPGGMPMGMHPMPGFQGSPYPLMPQHPYGGTNQYNAPVAPVDQLHHEGKKRSSIARDVAIGVAIAALVLGGFLAVKFLLLDGDGGAAEVAAQTPAFAKVQTLLVGGDAANLFVDDTLIATVRNSQDFDVQPGQRKVKLVGPAGPCFEEQLTLVAGKLTPVRCVLGAAPAPGAAVAAAPGTGSGSAAPSDPAAGSGSGSAAVAAPPADHPVPDKTDQMPVEDKAPKDKAAAEKAAADKAAADKAAAEKAAADKAAADKAIADKAASDKAAADKADKAATARRPVERTGATDRGATDKARAGDRAKPGSSDDDPLGKLGGGVRPDAKASTKKPR